MADPTSKTCSTCREVLPASEFHRSSRSASGLQAYCKACGAERQRAYRAKNPDRMREQGRRNMRRRRELRPDEVAAYQRDWRSSNPDKVRAAKAAWERDNYERFRQFANAASRKYKRSNPEKVAEYNKAWDAANPEAVAAKNRRWRERNPEAVRAKGSRRRAKIRNATVGDVDLLVLWAEQRAICGLCELPMDETLAWPDPLSRSVDHIVPLSRGGTHEQSNLQWTHLVCNIRKGAKAP